MGQFLHKYNTDNVHSRAVIVGMVNLLNSKIFFENVLSDTEIDTVYVPFYYNMGGDERFLQDFFLEWNDCVSPKYAEGNYDVIPRGIVTMTSKTIDPSKMTHRFVRGNYVKEINGELQTFSAYLNSIPIAMAFDVVIETDTVLDAFKIEQSLVETFYKNQVFSVTYRGFRIPCQAGFSEDYAVEKTFEFTYQADNKINVKFSIAVETYFPVLDSTTEQSNSKRMYGFNTVELSDEEYNRPRFTFTTPAAGDRYFSSGIIPISWGYTGAIRRVTLSYRLAGETEWRLIVRNLQNVGSYDWEVPFFDSNGNVVSNEPHRASVLTATGRNARVRAIIDAIGEVEKIVVFNRGLSYSATDTVGVNIHPMPYTLPPGYIPPVIQASVIAGEVIDTKIINPGSGFTPSPVTRIELKIESSNEESVYQILSDQGNFTGNADATTVNNYVTNLSPTVAELLQSYPLVGQTISGIGIPTPSTIIAANPILNRIEISNTINATTTGQTYVISESNGIIEIQ